MARKTPDTMAWGAKTATERYDGGSGSFGEPDKSEQKPQMPEDKHGPKYDNDVPLSGWLRGTDATRKPGFAKPWNKR